MAMAMAMATAKVTERAPGTARAEEGLRPVEVSLPPQLGSPEEVPVVGARPAALADLGRGGAGAGSATNVFRRRFPIANTLDNSVCAGADVQAAPGGSSTTRSCSN